MNKYLSYAISFVRYLLDDIKDLSNIKSIILFGSVARGEAGKDSDVDIFIETISKDKNNEKIVSESVERYYKSKEYLIFKNKEIDNKINVMVGELDEWKDLKESIISNGIVLFGKYHPDRIGGKRKIVLFWDKIGVNRGAFLNQIYGFNIKKKRYAGILEKHNGEKLGKSSIILPMESKKIIFALLRKYKVRAKFKEIYE